MSALSAAIDHHPALLTMLGYMVFNAFVAGMPPPAKPGGAYRWLYRSMNALAFNFGELIRSRLPQYPPISGAVQIETVLQSTTTTSVPGDPGQGNA